MKRAYIVTVELPRGVDSSMMADYIYKAVTSWTGGMDPEHPLGCKEIDVVVSYEANGHRMRVEKE